MRNQIFLNAHLRFQVFAKIPVSRSAFNKLSSHFPAAAETCFHLTRSAVSVSAFPQRSHHIFSSVTFKIFSFPFLFGSCISVFSHLDDLEAFCQQYADDIVLYLRHFILMIKCVELTSLSQRPCFSSSVQYDFREKPSHSSLSSLFQLRNEQNIIIVTPIVVL